MESKKIKYRGKEIEIIKVHGITILSTDKIFRRRMGIGKEVEDELIKEAKEIIDCERNKK